LLAADLIFLADNCEDGEEQHQHIGLHDSSASDWRSLSMGDGMRLTHDEFWNVFVCVLRWYMFHEQISSE